jgi:hypothetical protein
MKGDHATAMRCRLLATVLLLALGTMALPAGAAKVYKCTAPGGRTTFSDQPCPDTEQASEVELRGQPLIGNPQAAPAADEQEAGAEPVEEAEQKPPVEEEVEDERAPRLRRLDALLNQLYSGLNASGENCVRATETIEGWIGRHGKETRELFAAWDEVRFEKLNLKQKELEAMRTRMRGQVAQLKSVTLPKLNAKCWNDRALGAAFDRLLPYLPGN